MTRSSLDMSHGRKQCWFQLQNRTMNTPRALYVDGLHPAADEQNAAIAIVLPHFSHFSRATPTSIDSVAHNHVRYSRLKDNIVVIANATAPTFEGVTIASPVQPLERRQDWRRFVLRQLKDINPALIEVHYDFSFATKIKAALPRSRVVFVHHDQLWQNLSGLKKWRRKNNVARLDGIITVSKFVQAQFIDMFPQARARIFVCQNTIDLSSWHRPWDAPRQKRIVYAGRATPGKGIVPLVHAMARTLARHGDWHGVIMTHGWQDADSEIKSLRGELNGITPLDWRVDVDITQVRKTVQHAAIAVMPSIIPEGLPLSALEAHAAGAAFASSGAGGLAEASGGHALLLQRVDVEAISEALETLIQDEASRLELARRGQNHVRQTFDPNTLIAQLDDLRGMLI